MIHFSAPKHIIERLKEEMTRFILFLCTLLVLQTCTILTMEPVKKKHRINETMAQTKGLKEILEESGNYVLPLPYPTEAPVSLYINNLPEENTSSPSAKKKRQKKETVSKLYTIPCRIKDAHKQH